MVNDPSALPPSAAAPARLAEAIEAAGALVWWRELPAGAIHVNRPLAELLGLEPAPQGLSLERWAGCLHADDATRLLEVPRQGPMRVEARYRRPDDSWGVLLGSVVAQPDELGRPRRLTGVAQDITEYRQMEQALRQAHQRAALAARGAGLGTWELDLVTGQAQWDERMWQLRGLTPQPHALGREAQMALVHPDDRASVLTLMTNVLGASDIAQYEFRVVWPDGEVHWIASRSVALFDERGQPVRRIGVNWDVTDSRAAHQVRQERELALRESRAKAEFLARMSHELRTPLNAVLGLTQLLLDDGPGAADPAAATRRQRLVHIQAAGRQLLAMVDDALELGALPGESGQATPRPVPLSPLLDELEEALTPSRHGQAGLLERGDLTAIPWADLPRLRLLLRLLLSMTLRHAPASGVVAVDTRSAADRVIVTIGDPGPSPAPPRSTQSPQGSDAGSDSEAPSLALAHALAEQIHGWLRVQAAHDGRLGFAIDLPAEPPGEVADATTSRPVRGHVLYIEDNAVNAMIVADLIGRRRDLQGHIAATGLQGVTMAEQLHPDLILLDMQLPDIDGFEVLRRLRARPALAATRVIALSANAMPQEIERGLAAGLADYWTKPLDFAVFNAAMDSLLGSPDRDASD